MLQSLMKTNHFVTSKELTYMCNNLLCCTIYIYIYFFCPHLTLCILVNKYLVQASTHYLHLLILSSASEAATVILVFLFKAPFKSVSAIIMQRGSLFNDVPGCSTKKMDRKKTPKMPQCVSDYTLYVKSTRCTVQRAHLRKKCFLE